MTFTTKDWHDSPTTDTPISAAALEDMETRLAAYTDTKVAGSTGGFQSVTFASSITPDATAGSTVSVGALTGNITVNNPTGGTAGQSIRFIFTQDSTGGRTITWGSNFDLPRWQAGVDYPLGPNKITTVEFIYDGSRFKLNGTSAIVRPWFLNVQDFGAVTDWNGTTGTDATTAIQKAIDYAWPGSLSGHGSTWQNVVIYFPVGTSSYLVNSTININPGSATSTPSLTFLGDGAKIYTTTASDSPVWDLQDAVASMTNINFQGLFFFTNCARLSHKLRNCEYVRFTNCRWSGGGSTGVYIAETSSGSSVGNTWKNCQFDNMARAFLLHTGFGTIISNCEFVEACTLNWLELPARQSGFTGLNSNDTFTSPATIAQHGFMNGQQVTISGLTGGSGLNTATTYYITNRSATTFQLALTVGGSAVDLGSDVSAVTVLANSSGVQDLIFSGNVVYGQGATLPVLRLLDGDTKTISNNSFTWCSTAAIEIGLNGWGRATNIVGNVFRDNYAQDIEYDGESGTLITGNNFDRRLYQKWNVTVTMTIATPGVVTFNGHGFAADTPVRFSTSGALPTGITAGTTYYVRNPATNTFELGATAGAGSSIATSGSQSGTHKLLSGYSPIQMTTYGGNSLAGTQTTIVGNSFGDVVVNGIPGVPYMINADSHFTGMLVSGNGGQLPINIAGTGNTVAHNGLNSTFLNVRTFGALGDGTTDDTTAIQRAITALGANGGTIFFPYGTYVFSSTLDFNSKRSVRLLGEGGITAGATMASYLKFTGTGSGDAIRAKSSYGFSMSDIAVNSTSASFTGSLINLSASTNDTGYATLNRMYIGGQRSCILLNLNKATLSNFENLLFSGGAPAVRGKATSGDYANGISFVACTFVTCLDTTGAVRNGGQAWSFTQCNFEQCYNSGGSSAGAGAYAYDSGVGANGVSFNGCWFGDANTSGTWIDFAGSGLSVRGCYIGSGGTAISAKSSAFAIDICGNQFDTTGNGITLVGSNVFHIAGNEFTGLTGIAIDIGASGEGIITGNRVTGAATGIRYADALQHLVVAGNYLNGATTAASYLGSLPAASLLQKGAAAQLLHTSFMTNAGAISDGSWPATPADGTIGIDTTNSKLYARIGGTWKSVTLT